MWQARVVLRVCWVRAAATRTIGGRGCEGAGDAQATSQASLASQQDPDSSPSRCTEEEGGSWPRHLVNRWWATTEGGSSRSMGEEGMSAGAVKSRDRKAFSTLRAGRQAAGAWRACAGGLGSSLCSLELPCS